jgi:uncharacterized protein with PIN domain
MTIELPESMEELIYWTTRKVGDGSIKAWAPRGYCPECNKGLMGKPKDPKTGKPKIRASYYICPECNYEVGKTAYEETLTVSIIYTCPHCKHKDDAQIPFKRKKYKGVDSLIFVCSSCNEKIPITKKMKVPKK